MGMDEPYQGTPLYIVAQICSRGNPPLSPLSPAPWAPASRPSFFVPIDPSFLHRRKGSPQPGRLPRGPGWLPKSGLPIPLCWGGNRSSVGAKTQPARRQKREKIQKLGVLLTNSAGNGGFRKCQVPDSFLSCRWGDRRGSAAAKPRRRHPATGGPRGWGPPLPGLPVFAPG